MPPDAPFPSLPEVWSPSHVPLRSFSQAREPEARCGGMLQKKGRACGPASSRPLEFTASCVLPAYESGSSQTLSGWASKQ